MFLSLPKIHFMEFLVHPVEEHMLPMLNIRIFNILDLSIGCCTEKEAMGWNWHGSSKPSY